MTRKTALTQAISILSKQKGTEKIIEKLQGILEDLPLVHWTDGTIRDACDQFVKEKKRNPLHKDFKNPLPSPTVIQKMYRISIEKWLQENYPTRTLSFEEKKKKYTCIFIKEYNAIEPKTAKEFNDKKKQSVNWETVAKYNGVCSWRKLIAILKLKVFQTEDKLPPCTQFEVTVSSDIPEFNDMFFNKSQQEFSQF